MEIGVNGHVGAYVSTALNVIYTVIPFLMR